MAILEMEKITIYGLNQYRKQLLETLHKMEAVEIKALDFENLGVNKKETEKSIAQFTDHLASAEQAIEILEQYAPVKTGMFSKRPVLDESQYSMASTEYDQVRKDIYAILRLSKAMKENQDAIGKIAMQQAGLTPYLDLDVPMDLRGTKDTVITVGTLPGTWSNEQVVRRFQEAELFFCHAEILSATKEQTALWVMYPKKEAEQCRNILREIEFAEPPFHLSHHAPKKKLALLQEEKDKLKSAQEDIKVQLMDYTKRRDAICLFYDHLILRREKYEALSAIGLTKNTFMITGFVPKIAADRVEQELTKEFSCYVERKPATQEDNPPVEFKNAAVIAPVEGITGDYSMPGPEDVDPNPIMAWFYYFFFGMMFSDAGYGLLMMIGCGILGFSNIMEKSKRRMYKMFFFCGVSTTFWGIMYGSFFGDMIKTVSTTFGNGTLAFNPILMDPVAKPLELLIISVAFGMVHILFGLGIKFYMTWRQGHKLDAIFDVGFWMIVLLGISLFAGGMGLGIAVLNKVGMVMAIIGAVGLLVTQGRKSKNIIGKLFGGVLSLYDITSYVGDVLSYSRLMALGLATGVIASVINVLAAFSGPSVLGVILFIVISLVGHALNFAINMLGAYVHTNRLQYVEFYQKFYEGGGRKFKPFAMGTKYFNFSK